LVRGASAIHIDQLTIQDTFMNIPANAIVAVADGEKIKLFRNTGTGSEVSLSAMAEPDVDAGATGGGSSSANPDQSRAEEDGFATGIVEMLNRKVLGGKFKDVVIVAAPKTLGEMRKHYHKKLEDVLVGEIAKDLTGHSIADIEKAISAA
jgi:protein required for attachment to host cells